MAKEGSESLEEFLKALGKQHDKDYLQFLSALRDQGIESRKDLEILTEDDIKELVKDTGMGKPARRHLINAIKSTQVPLQVPISSFVIPMSEAESKAVTELGERYKKALDFKEQIESYQKLVPKESEVTALQIKKATDEVIKAAETCALEWKAKLDCEVKSKEEALGKELKNITDILEKLKTATTECYRALSLQTFEQLKERQERISASVSNVKSVTIPTLPQPPKFSFEFDAESKAASLLLKIPKEVLQFLGSRWTRQTLLWQGTRDGFSSSKFHSKCDNRGATLTVIKSTSGHLFGGYNDASWTSNGTYNSSGAPWLFSITSGVELTWSKGYTTYNHSSYGPTFGSGHDLSVSNDCSYNQSSYSSPSSFQRKDGGHFSDTLLAGSRNFQVAEIYVFQVVA